MREFTVDRDDDGFWFVENVGGRIVAQGFITQREAEKRAARLSRAGNRVFNDRTLTLCEILASN